MKSHLVRPLAAAIAAVALLVAHPWRDAGLGIHVAAQVPDRMPGPIIEDPPGAFTRETYVGPGNRLVVPGAALSTFVVAYNGFSPAAQAAFQAAVDIWASEIQSSVPIRVTANWTTLGTNVLGSAGATSIFRDFSGAPLPGTWYAAAVAKKLNGTDLTAGSADIVANFNSTFDWYLGTDGLAGSKYDLESVVLHELGHGLGFFGSMNGSGGTGSWGLSTGFPIVYDTFAINGSSQFLLNTTLFPNPSAALGAQLVSNNIYFNGPNSRSRNSGVAPKLYTPGVWSAGSSYSHLDEATYPNGSPNSLMTYALSPGEVIHSIGPIVEGLFTDIGWNVVAPVVRRSPGDFDGDGKSDVTTYRPATGTWYVLKSTTNYSLYNGYQFGVSSDVTVPADYDGDGKTDIAIYRPATGYLVRAAVVDRLLELHRAINGASTRMFRCPPTTMATARRISPSTGQPPGSGTLLRSTTNSTNYISYQWGVSTDVPVPGDYDGDHKADIAVYRPATGIWYVLLSTTNSASFVSYQWGVSSDTPVAADYDGDGKADVAIYRPATGIWYVLLSTTNSVNFVSYQWGVSTDTPVPGDYDGDGKTDIAVFRPATGFWFALRSSVGGASYSSYQWGVSTDVPINKRP